MGEIKVPESESLCRERQADPTMMLLIGMKMSLTKNPTNPITTNPIAVRTATFENSTRQTQPQLN